MFLEEEICVGCFYVLDNNPLSFTCIADISLRLHLFSFKLCEWGLLDRRFLCLFVFLIGSCLSIVSVCFTFYWFKSIPGFALYILFFFFSTSCAYSTLLISACTCRENCLSPSLPQYIPLKYSEISSSDLHQFVPCQSIMKNQLVGKTQAFGCSLELFMVVDICLCEVLVIFNSPLQKNTYYYQTTKYTWGPEVEGTQKENKKVNPAGAWLRLLETKESQTLSRQVTEVTEPEIKPESPPGKPAAPLQVRCPPPLQQDLHLQMLSLNLKDSPAGGVGTGEENCFATIAQLRKMGDRCAV